MLDKKNFFALSVMILILQVNADRTDDYAQSRRKCKQEFGFPEDGPLTSGTDAFLANPKAKCYLSCFLADVKLWDENKELDIEQSVVKIDEDIRDKARALVTKCAAEGAGMIDQCEKAFKIIKCFHDAAPKEFLLLGTLEPPKEV